MIFFLVIFFAPLLNAMEENNFKIICADKKEISLSHEQKNLLFNNSGTIKHMIADFPELHEQNSLPLENISEFNMKKILTYLPYAKEDANKEKLQKKFNKLPLEQSSSLLNTIDYLDINPLITFGSNVFAQKLTTQEELNKFIQDQNKLPHLNPGINKLVAKSIIQNHSELLLKILNHVPISSKELTADTGSVRSVAFNKKSDMLASGYDDCTIRLWEVTTGNCLRTLIGHTNSVLSVAFNNESTILASGSDDCTIRLWEVKTGNCLRTLIGHTRWVNSVAFNNESVMLASGSRDNTIRLWEVKTGNNVRTLTGHTHWVNSVAFNKESDMLASGSDDDTIRLWDVKTGNCLRMLTGHTNSVRSVAFNKESDMLASGSDDITIHLWNVKTGNCLRTLTGYTSEVNSVAFNNESDMLASGSDDDTIRLWEVTTGNCVRTLTGHTNFVNSVAFNKESDVLASGSSDNTIRLWDLKTFNKLHKFLNELTAQQALGLIHLTQPRETVVDISHNKNLSALFSEEIKQLLIDHYKVKM